MQLAIDWTIPNNQHRGNQSLLDENREHFSGQALFVFQTLMKGGKVSSKWAWEQGIVDLRARCFSLRKKGVIISEEKIPNGHGAKCWFCTEEDIKYNLSLLNK